MIAFSLIFWGILFATLIPAFIALYLVRYLKAVPTRYLAAAGLGLIFMYFFDTMGDAASLDENFSVYPASFFGGLSHWGLIAAFVLGVAVLATFDRYALEAPEATGGAQGTGSTRRNSYLFLIPLAVAFVMGVHGLGEGWDASSAVASANINTGSVVQALIQAFGDLPSVISYPVHKFLEASVVGIVYAAYVVRLDGGDSQRWWQVPMLGLFFGVPSVIGASAGYFVAFDTTYFFAFGVTAALYAALRLVEPMAPDFDARRTPAHFGTRTFLALAIGFFLLYSAALLH